MPQYRRWFQPGGSFFFTVVADGRRPLFADPAAVRLLGNCFREVIARRPFRMPGVVVLPDRLHAIWKLPDGDARFDARWTAVKAKFTRGHLTVRPTASSGAFSLDPHCGHSTRIITRGRSQ